VKLFSLSYSVIFIFIISIGLSSCSKGFNTPSRAQKNAKRNPTTGKDETSKKGYYSNPFKGGTRGALQKYKRKKQKRLFRNGSGAYKNNKNGKSRFKMKRTISKSRLKSSGSNYKRKGGGGGSRKNNNLFKTRKK
jgi:hypothetical protein|tara:strand:- start:216 stop:620 length:405 start_codon:yes stop_codon:yes gene_type:complete